jgi:type IV pilus assembly protein PilN
VADLIDRQNQRNAFLQQQIRVVNQKISEIKRLEDERKALLDRMAIIQRLQTSRPEIVHLFDELPRLLPEGVFLTSLAQKNRVVTLSGVAQSNARVSSFMRNLDGSEWLTDPVLEVIKSVELEGPPPQRVAEFTLAVKQVNPQAKDEDTSGGAE